MEEIPGRFAARARRACDGALLPPLLLHEREFELSPLFPEEREMGSALCFTATVQQSLTTRRAINSPETGAERRFVRPG